jgi:D-glycero-D-manno-heptose 1,7-bisphosphate phosphatase
MNRLEPADAVVILDRDGTVVVDRHFLSNPADLEFLPGAAAGLRSLCVQGHRLVVITNQSGVGRGLFSLPQLHDIHDRFRDMVGAAGARLERIYFCPHTPDDDCACRKPRLGLLVRAASDLHFDPTRAVVIGDKASDIEFGRRAGATTILISPQRDIVIGESAPDFVAADLTIAARFIEHLRAPPDGGKAMDSC